MPGRIFLNTGFVNWSPSDDDISNDTVVRYHSVGAGGHGHSSIMNPGGGGGGGVRAASEITISDNSVILGIWTPAGGEQGQHAYVQEGMTYHVRSPFGEHGQSEAGGAGGTGGVGNLFLRDGGAGGSGGSSVGGGGGGGGGGSDAAAGNNGLDGGATDGGAGGAGQTQFGVANAGAGGTGANLGEDGGGGFDYGGGGGGGSAAGTHGLGKQGVVFVMWGALLEAYPTTWVDGFFGDPEGEPEDEAGVLILGSDDNDNGGAQNQSGPDFSDGYA